LFFFYTYGKGLIKIDFWKLFLFTKKTYTLLSFIQFKVRLIMKLHSFAIETRELMDKEKDINLKYYPKLSQFLYFLVAPTLIYRNSYPMY
jgi:sterol O-acyltransferase